MKPAYYNEIDPYAAQWLRNLISAGLIPAGDVDDRSIVDVGASDLAGYGQCHFFAGIGGFGLACRLAGVPDDFPIWTGGFPCQPFSVAGRQLAQEDDRHLWPVLSRLVEQARPAVFVGENVAGIIDLALDGVLFDLESAGYASRAFVVPACAVNAPHRRDRVWIASRRLADADSEPRQQNPGSASCDEEAHGRTGRVEREPDGDNGPSGNGESGRRALADADIAIPSEERQQRGGEFLRSGEDQGTCLDDVGNPGSQGLPGGEHGRKPGAPQRRQQERAAATKRDRASVFWDRGEYRVGADGKARRVEPRIRLLAHGVSGRVAVGRTVGQSYTANEEPHWVNRIGALRAGGNAIVPQVAAEIIRAATEGVTP